MKFACRQNSKAFLRSIGLLALLFICLCACGGGKDSGVRRQTGEVPTHNWERIPVVEFETSGFTIPFVVARQAPDSLIHIAYYEAVAMPDDTYYYQMRYVTWNPNINRMVQNLVVDNKPAPTGVLGFNRCDQFDLALDDTTPVLIYPTYENHDTGLQYEADVMVNLYQNGQWNELTGAIGFVPRNPVFQDGHATESMSVAVDSQGNIHACYQYYTEGIDSNNEGYADLSYVFRDRATLLDAMDVNDYAGIEEIVDGNQFSTFGVHNKVGYFCKLVLDPDEMPVIAYSEQGEHFNGRSSLKVAYRNASGQWSRETVDALPHGWTVGGISAAFYPPPPEDPEADPEAPEPERPLAIAYAIRSPSPEPDDGHRLMFAVKREGRWDTEIVDETTWCGAYPSLAFTPEGFPAIAYLDEQSHSGRPHHFLKYAEWNGILWVKESADEQDLPGLDNSLWFDAQGRPNICTFADPEDEDLHQILIIRQIE